MKIFRQILLANGATCLTMNVLAALSAFGPFLRQNPAFCGGWKILATKKKSKQSAKQVLGQKGEFRAAGTHSFIDGQKF